MTLSPPRDGDMDSLSTWQSPVGDCLSSVRPNSLRLGGRLHSPTYCNKRRRRSRLSLSLMGFPRHWLRRPTFPRATPPRALPFAVAAILPRHIPSVSPQSRPSAGRTFFSTHRLGFLSSVAPQVLNCRETCWWSSHCFRDARYQIHQDRSSTHEEPMDPFSLVADELSVLDARLCSMVVAEVPKLSSAAEYFFKKGVEGKRVCPTVLLLMASALDVSLPNSATDGMFHNLSKEIRAKQLCIAEIAEMIHVASLLHDHVLDDAEMRRGVGLLNFVMGNKLAVLMGDFLLSRACAALASLKNAEVLSLLATVLEHLVTGETMQVTATSEQHRSMEYYLQKTYYKTASLVSNCCKAVALLGGQTAEVSLLAYDYGRNLGIAYQLIDDVLDFTGTSSSLGKGSLSDIRHGIITAPLLFAMEEFPQLQHVVDQGFKNPANIDLALDYLGRSQGIQRARDLATEHANCAAKAIESLPESGVEDVIISRRALVNLTQRFITRTK